MDKVTHVLYHGNCADGFGAAFAAWTIRGDQAEYVPVRHGDPLPELPETARVAIVDFSWGREALVRLSQRVQELIVLDHHKSAQQELQDLPFARFDIDKSGARMAWEYWRPGEPMPRLLEYVEDHDLWRHQLPYSGEVSTALHSYPMEFEVWQGLEVDHLAQEGRAILRYQRRQVERAVSRVVWQEIAGYTIPTVNSCLLPSEIGEELCFRYPDSPFAGVYYDNHRGEEAWSLRSRGDFDVSVVAASLGGGGHKNAAGFARKRPT